MGWSGGTEIFDVVVGNILRDDSIVDKQMHIKELLIVLEDKDWDNVGESIYWDNQIVRDVILERHPDWIDEEDDE